MFGKKLNVAGEIAGRALKDISIFKSVTGNDRIVGEFKGHNPFYFTSRCKLLFSGNTLPLTTELDTTAAFVYRIRVLLFNTSVPPEEQDKQLLGKLWDERDSIVTRALRTAHELMERNFEFTLPRDSEKFLVSFSERNNVILGFIDVCCELNPNAKVFNTDLCRALKAYCTENGVDCPKRAEFYDRLSGYPHVIHKCVRIGDKSLQGHVGIRLKKKAETFGTMEHQS